MCSDVPLYVYVTNGIHMSGHTLLLILLIIISHGNGGLDGGRDGVGAW